MSLSLLKRITKAFEAAADLFFESCVRPLPHQDFLIAAIIFVGAFLAYGLLAPNLVGNGDGAVYVDQISQGNLTALPTHIGYYLVAFPFSQIKLLPLDFTFNLINCLFGALTLAVIYLLGFMISHKRVVGLFAAGVLGVNLIFVFNSIFAEIYITQTFFLLLAFFLWLSAGSVLAGISFAIAFLVTPASVLAIPCFLVLRPKPKDLFKFFAAFVVPAALILVPFWHEYLFGGRGLLLSASRTFILQDALSKEASEFFNGFVVAVPFVLSGAGLVIVQKERRIFGFAVLGMWVVIFYFAETTGDVPVQLPTYTLFAVLAGFGLETFLPSDVRAGYWARLAFVAAISAIIILRLLFRPDGIIQLSPRMLDVFIVVCVAYVILGVWNGTHRLDVRTAQIAVVGLGVLMLATNAYQATPKVQTEITAASQFHDYFAEIDRAAASPDYVIVGGWDTGARYEHYFFHTAYSNRWVNPRWLLGNAPDSVTMQPSAIQYWKEALAAKKELWILDRYEDVAQLLKKAGYTVKNVRDKVYKASPPE